MATNKQSFVLYCDLVHTVRKLSDEQSGKLFKHILEYVNDQDPDACDPLIDIVFEPIKQSLKRDLDKYYKTVERNRVNGSKGGRPTKPKESKKNQSVISKPKKADSDTDSDSVIDNDSGIIKSPKVDFDCVNFLEFINKTLNKKYTVVTKTVQAKIQARLREGYTREQFRDAVLSVKTDQFHKDNNYQYATIEYFSRSSTLDKHGFNQTQTPTKIYNGR